ncbi:hypothetical protein Tco_0558661 [Tanacetum coccineum]
MVLRERERKARTTLLMAIPEDHLAKFHKMTDAKDMWIAIKSRFGGNDESKKMQKYILKQQFEGFTVSNSDGIHKGYERFQSLLSQLEIHGAETSELVFEPVVNESHVEVQPKVWSDAPIIEEYESDSDDDDENVYVKIEDLDTPSFATKHVKTPSENVKNNSTHKKPHRTLRIKEYLKVDVLGTSATGNRLNLAAIKTLMVALLPLELVLPAMNSQIEDESAQDCFEVPYWHSYSSKNTSYSKSDEKRRSPREEEQVFLDDLARLQRQEKEANEEAEALTRNHEQDTEKALLQAEAAKTSILNDY